MSEWLGNEAVSEWLGNEAVSEWLGNEAVHCSTVLPCPLQVQASIAGIVAAHTASKQEAIAAWEGDKRKVSK